VGIRDRGRRSWDLPGFVAEIQHAEKLGFYCGYVGERFGHGDASGDHASINDSFLACAYGLSQSTTFRMASGVALLSLRHPVQMAVSAAVLNAMYPGRYRCGVGAAYSADDFAAFGVDRAEAAQRMAIGLRAMNAYRADVPMILDPPLSGTVPHHDPAMGDGQFELIAAAWSHAGVRRAARYADAWLADPLRTIDAIKELSETYRNECENVGKTPHIILMREAAVAETDYDASALEPYQLVNHKNYYARGGGAYDPRFDKWLGDIASADDITYAHIGPNRFLAGSAATVSETLRGWQADIGFEEIVLRLRYYHGPGLDFAMDTMTRIANYVMPNFLAASPDYASRA
jgi:alkanesulfonate monooxygenase SsuD/methylene tetrahydromethanopterin reductase-like flavin-dependent oxidoreductase (luciferase family)